MGLRPDTIVCSPELYMTIRAALLPGVAGVIRPEAELIQNIIVSEWIDGDATDYFLLCTKKAIKPIFFQLRQAPQFVALDSINDYNAFMAKEFLYGVDARYVVGYGDPRYAVMINAA